MIVLLTCLAATVTRFPDSANTKAQTTAEPKPTKLFTDDFTLQTWGTGPSSYGSIWYQDDEYHMRATRGGYIVMYAPDKKDYYTENAIVSIGLRSVQADSPVAGYGLVVHGERKRGKLEDYAFLIYTGVDPKYKIIMHRAGVERRIIPWTPTKDLRIGTAPNQLEVRIKNRDLAFYINGQFQNTIRDTQGWMRGRVGFYTSDVPEIAFDDLVIARDQPATDVSPQGVAQTAVLEPVSRKTDLYPANADAPKEIQEALRRAVTEKKRVLLIFGGNWCYDCHVLDRALHEGIAGKIVSESFILVHVDIGEGEKNPDLVKTYRIPLNKGVPAVAVLRSDGKILYSSGDGEFESARTMLKKDLVTFLRRWKTE